MTLQKSARDFVKHSAQKMGIAVDFYPPPGSFRRQLRDLLAQMKINVVLDVGAYIGTHALAFPVSSALQAMSSPLRRRRAASRS